MKKSELSAAMIPVDKLWDKVLFIGLFGVIDSKPAKQVIEAMLDKIIECNARFIILDILSAPAVDSTKDVGTTVSLKFPQERVIHNEKIDPPFTFTLTADVRDQLCLFMAHQRLSEDYV